MCCVVGGTTTVVILSNLFTLPANCFINQLNLHCPANCVQVINIRPDLTLAVTCNNENNEFFAERVNNSTNSAVCDSLLMRFAIYLLNITMKAMYYLCMYYLSCPHGKSISLVAKYNCCLLTICSRDLKPKILQVAEEREGFQNI